MTNHSDDTAATDQPATPELTTEEATFLLEIYMTGFMSGAMTIMAARPGADGTTMPASEALVCARYIARQAQDDPAARHEVLEGIRHLHEQRHKNPDGQCPGCASGSTVRTIDIFLGRSRR